MNTKNLVVLHKYENIILLRYLLLRYWLNDDTTHRKIFNVDSWTWLPLPRHRTFVTSEMQRWNENILQGLFWRRACPKADDLWQLTKCQKLPTKCFYWSMFESISILQEVQTFCSNTLIIWHRRILELFLVYIISKILQSTYQYISNRRNAIFITWVNFSLPSCHAIWKRIDWCSSCLSIVVIISPKLITQLL